MTPPREYAHRLIRLDATELRANEQFRKRYEAQGAWHEPEGQPCKMCRRLCDVRGCQEPQTHTAMWMQTPAGGVAKRHTERRCATCAGAFLMRNPDASLATGVRPALLRAATVDPMTRFDDPAGYEPLVDF